MSKCNVCYDEDKQLIKCNTCTMELCFDCMIITIKDKCHVCRNRFINVNISKTQNKIIQLVKNEKKGRNRITLNEYGVFKTFKR